MIIGPNEVCDISIAQGSITRRRKDSQTTGHVQGVSIKFTILDPSDAKARHAALFEAHFADIWKSARRRCESSHDADDVTAETFAVAWRRRDDMPDDNARLWLFGVARRVLANHQRSAKRQDRVRLRLADIASPQETWDTRGESSGALRAALGALAPDDRDLLTMRGWDELSIGDMATILGCSENAISVRLHKARGRLACELQRKENSGSGHVTNGSLSAEGETT